MKTHSRIPFKPLAAMLLLAALSQPGHAQDGRPAAQYWVDASTNSMSIPGMEDAGESGAGSMMGGMLGGGRGGAGMGGMGSPGRTLDLSLYTRAKPAGTEGAHAIPPGMKMGDSLPLLPANPGTPSGPRERAEGQPEKPKGRMLLYWGCGDTVRAGQPRIMDFAQSSPADYGKFMAGRHVPDRVSRAGNAIWPNERDSQRVPREASLAGNHLVSGNGVPASLKFAVDEANDFLPALRMSAAGDPKQAVTVEWNSLANAKAYFLTAMGSKGRGDASDMILWSSSEQPEPGWGLMDYLPPASISKFLEEKVILPPSTQKCTVPSGIFAEAQGAMVRMIAYGPELNLGHPPRPAKAGAPWNPEWTVRVRVKSTGLTMLGQEGSRGGSRRGRVSGGDAPGQDASGASGGSGSSGGSPVDVLRHRAQIT